MTCAAILRPLSWKAWSLWEAPSRRRIFRQGLDKSDCTWHPMYIATPSPRGLIAGMNSRAFGDRQIARFPPLLPATDQGGSTHRQDRLNDSRGFAREAGSSAL